MASCNLFTILTQQAPDINVQSNGLAPSNYFPGAYCMPVGKVSEWEDLTLTNVLYAYGHVLSEPFTGTMIDLASLHIPYLLNITTIREMERGWLHRLLPQPLNQGLNALTGNQGTSAILIRQDYQLPGPRPGSAITLRSPDGHSEALVLGASRPQADWESGPFTHQFHPLSQAAGYGNRGGTRYTYIVTEANIIFCQIYLLDEDHATPQYGVRYRSIPLAASGVDALTPALALWTVAMMAVGPSSRRVETLDNTARLNSWFLSPSHDRVRNAVSGRVTDRAPAGAHIIYI